MIGPGLGWDSRLTPGRACGGLAHGLPSGGRLVFSGSFAAAWDTWSEARYNLRLEVGGVHVIEGMLACRCVPASKAKREAQQCNT
jgi:hypothetical protein